MECCMDWLEQKYIGLLSNRLRNYKRKSSGLYNFSCPLCGDSQSIKSRARAYIYEKKGKSAFHCHNCGASMGVSNFIKMIDQSVYNEYVMEKLRGNKTEEQLDLENFVNKMKKPVFLKEGPLKGLKKISQLSPDSPAKQLVVSRKIPTPYHAKLFLCPNFKSFTNNLISGKFSNESLQKDETRILIPFFDKNKKLHAYQGRSIGKSEPRYITIVLDEETPKIYGLDTVDDRYNIYVFEGPIDSMFIHNSIATAGGDLVSSLKGFDKSNMIIVYDNEPRNSETIKKLDKAILQGYNVCIFPENLEHKDVNDMILAGLSPEFIKHIIDTHTYKDLAAKLALTKWSKI
jgi:transcription elongation factor Elf1